MDDEFGFVCFVEDGRKRKGPYSMAQLKQALNQGEIQPNQIVTSESIDQPNMTVIDLIKSSSDPAYTLLEALQVTLERQEESRKILKPATPPSSYTPRSSESRSEKAGAGSSEIRIKIWTIPAAVLVVVAVGGLVYYLNSPDTPASKDTPTAQSNPGQNSGQNSAQTRGFSGETSQNYPPGGVVSTPTPTRLLNRSTSSINPGAAPAFNSGGIHGRIPPPPPAPPPVDPGISDPSQPLDEYPEQQQNEEERNMYIDQNSDNPPPNQ